MSDSLRPHESQHTRLPCPSPTLGIYSNPYPSSRWCHPATSSSCRPLLLLPPIPPSIRVFSNEYLVQCKWYASSCKCFINSCQDTANVLCFLEVSGIIFSQIFRSAVHWIVNAGPTNKKSQLYSDFHLFIQQIGRHGPRCWECSNKKIIQKSLPLLDLAFSWRKWTLNRMDRCIP